MSKAVIFILLAAVVGGGVYLYTARTQHGATASAPSDSLDREFDQAAHDKLPMLIRACESGYKKGMDFIAGKPEGTAPSGKWTGKFIKGEARRLEADKESDAAGFVTYEITREDGTTERKTDELRRKRNDGKWEFFSAPVTTPEAERSVAIPSVADTRKSFEAYARRFLQQVVPALRQDDFYKGYAKFDTTRNEKLGVDTKGGTVVGYLTFDASSGAGFASDSFATFDLRFEFKGGSWEFVSGEWVWSGFGTRSTLNTTTSPPVRKAAIAAR